MFMMNRSAVIIKAKAPFVDWLNKLPDNLPDMQFDLNSVNEDGYLFLIEEFEDSSDAELWVKKNSSELFELLLEDWCTAADWWPKIRNYGVFKEWFSWEIFLGPKDLLDGDIMKEEI